MQPSDERPHVLTVSVEEYFHGEALSEVVQEKHWERFESRLEPSIGQVLRKLEGFGAKATFFVLGSLAERHPDLVRGIAESGHEVAVSGFWPRRVRGMGREEFVEEFRRARYAVEAAIGQAVLGHRAARWIGPEDLWILDCLAEQGIAYDASVHPRLGRFPRELRVAHDLPSGIRELPVTIDGEDLRLRNPRRARRRAERSRLREEAPMLFSFQSWELDPDQPRVTAASRSDRLRHYRNLHRMVGLLEPYLREFRMVSARELLDLPVREVALQARPTGDGKTRVPAGARTPVSVVVPMFDEEQNVSFLLRTLDSVQERLRDRYELELVLVDDGSTDRTWDVLQRLCAERADTRLVRHADNEGVARAILTGIRAARHETVVSVDCDCSYDPHEIEHLVPLLESADLVTASPYHPDGRVLHVPGWRLFLSKTLSRLYRRVLRSDLHTFTSCFRAYRRSSVQDMELDHGGFLGVAEMLVRVLRKGGRVVEYPTLLESRLMGFSKMRTLHTIRGHLGMLWTQLRRGP